MSKTITMPISEARIRMNRLDELLAEHKVIYAERHGKPVFAFADLEYWDACLETVEILSDPDALTMLTQAIDDVKHGRLHAHEDVERELLP